MKTYTVDTYTQRLAAYLMAVHYPFHFDGQSIEFTASKSFIENMKQEDRKFAEVDEFN